MKKIVLFIWILISPLMAFSLFEDKASDKEYLEFVTLLKDVTIDTQKVRGLTNSFKNGNVAAQLLVYAQRESLEKDISKVEGFITKYEVEEDISKEAKELIKKVRKWNSKAFRKESTAVFSGYTAIVESLINLNGKFINTYFKKGDAKVYTTLTMMNETLLPLTENIGKLRGMGSGIVARGSCNENEAVTMKAFTVNIEKYRLEMQAYFKKHGCRRFSTRKLVEFDVKIADYTKLVNEKVIGKEGIALDANKYFDQGTACISDVISIYDAMSEELAKQLSK